jgi:hypothetical protein
LLPSRSSIGSSHEISRMKDCVSFGASHGPCDAKGVRVIPTCDILFK